MGSTSSAQNLSVTPWPPGQKPRGQGLVLECLRKRELPLDSALHLEKEITTREAASCFSFLTCIAALRDKGATWPMLSPSLAAEAPYEELPVGSGLPPNPFCLRRSPAQSAAILALLKIP